MGDYDPEIHVGNYVSDLKLALRQTDILERKIMELHKKREPNQDVQIAVDEFLAIARNLETYGIDPHPVKDHRGTQIYLGINSTGISTYASGKRVQHFRWPEVHKLNYEGKMFIAHLSYTDRESREPVNFIRWCIYKKSTWLLKLYLSHTVFRKSIPLASSVQRAALVAIYGDVQSNKCYSLRKFLFIYLPKAYQQKFVYEFIFEIVCQIAQMLQWWPVVVLFVERNSDTQVGQNGKS